MTEPSSPTPSNLDAEVQELWRHVAELQATAPTLRPPSPWPHRVLWFMGACCLVASWFEGMTWLAVAVALWTLSTPSAESYGTWRRNERRRQDQLALIEWERKFRAAHAAARVELEIVPDWMR